MLKNGLDEQWITPINESFKVIALLHSLTDLDLSTNYLLEMPDELCELSSLTNLNLSDNFLGALPRALRNLSLLEDINLSGNSFTKLSSWMVDLMSLEHIYIFDIEKDIVEQSDEPEELRRFVNFLRFFAG